MQPAHLRIGDAERERAATALGEHYAQGRITTEEHAERLDRIWSARTYGDLRHLFRDLPEPAPVVEPVPGRAIGATRSARAPSAYWSGGRRRGPLPPPILLVLGVLALLTIVTHLPFVVAGLLVILFVSMRRRRRATRWGGHP